MRILIAEDDRKVASFIRQGLEEESHAVEVAADGQTALELVSVGPPVDLVILDVMLPRRDGFSVLRALRDAGVGTPVLAAAGAHGRGSQARGRRSRQGRVHRAPYRAQGGRTIHRRQRVTHARPAAAGDADHCPRRRRSCG